MFLIPTSIVLVMLVGTSVAPTPPPSPVKATPTTEKLFYTVKKSEVEAILAKGYKALYTETDVTAVSEVSQGQYRLTVQDHKMDNACLQRVKIYIPKKNIKTKNKEWDLRDDTLATCDGGHDIQKHSKNRFGYANAIHFYGSKRTIFRLLDGQGSYKCKERSYIKKPPQDKELTKLTCDAKIKRIYTYQGAVRNLLYNIFRHSSS